MPFASSRGRTGRTRGEQAQRVSTPVCLYIVMSRLRTPVAPNARSSRARPPLAGFRAELENSLSVPPPWTLCKTIRWRRRARGCATRPSTLHVSLMRRQAGYSGPHILTPRVWFGPVRRGGRKEGTNEAHFDRASGEEYPSGFLQLRSRRWARPPALSLSRART